VADIDVFATSLLEEAKRFLERAQTAPDDVARDANLHAALMLGFCSLEAHVNAIAEDFGSREELTPHEMGILLEKEVRLENGRFVVGGFRMHRLEDRILFLYLRFSGKSLDKSASWWSQLAHATNSRNRLTHPKETHTLTVTEVGNALAAIIGTIDALYRAIYKSGFPLVGMGLHSSLTF
jgi:hypothetical protein